MAGDGLGTGEKEPQDNLQPKGDRASGQRRIIITRGHALPASPYAPDAALPPGADVADDDAADASGWRRELPPAPQREDAAPLRVHAKPREVPVRDLKTERAGRVFPCMQEGAHYTGCVGYDACKVLCWSPRPREREALVRVEKPTAGPCRDCVYAREVRGEVAAINGRQVRLMECRLGYWHGRTTVQDFVVNKIALNVGLPCPGYTETDMPHPAVAKLREAARRRKMGTLAQKEEEPDE
jgi:hypothetical protein